MRRFFIGVTFLTASVLQLHAQRACHSFGYEQEALAINPALKTRLTAVENFVQQQITLNKTRGLQRGGGITLITIPVVVHILYHQPGENISDEKVYEQLAVLNKSFRRLNADTINTPERFAALAADIEIEFQLATSDPKRRGTTGIIRKYTPVTTWEADDKMKFSDQMGDDAWNSSNYLNIWVVNLNRQLGYASFPGLEPEKDGLVIGHRAFGVTKHSSSGYEMGKTAVHEIGHWLGLRHIWGDGYCGDDWVDDTPKQGNFTSGCPSGTRLSCSSGAAGDMYMNYMDLSSDACINLFTNGQKERMRSYFEPGGERYAMLSSTGLLPPLTSEIPVTEEPPRWLYVNVYPNPASSQLTIDVSSDARWIGKTLFVSNLQGQSVMQQPISAKIQTIDISRLPAGIYFLFSRKEDGAVIKQKFVKI